MEDAVAQITTLHKAIADVQTSSASSALRIEAVASSVTAAAALQQKRSDEQFAKMMDQFAKLTGPSVESAAPSAASEDDNHPVSSEQPKPAVTTE